MFNFKNGVRSRKKKVMYNVFFILECTPPV